jgi:hypothetical protein
MTTSPILLKRFWRGGSNNTKKGHKQWLKWATRAIQICQGSFAFGRLVWYTPVTARPFLMSLDLSRRDFFNDTNDVIIGVSMCIQSLFFVSLFFFLLSPPCNLWRKKREKSKKINKKILKAHRSSGDDTFSTVEKISTRQIQRHQGRSWTVTGVCHISHSKTNEP